MSQQKASQPRPTLSALQDLLEASSTEVMRQLFAVSQHWLERLETLVEQELLIPLTETQINDALQNFVVKNVAAVLDLFLDLHDGWLTLHAVVNTQGVFAKLEVDLRLVHVQLDRHRQRFVFQQLSDTRVVQLYTDNYLKTKAIDGVLWYFHKVKKSDPLGLILGKINLARQKEDILYLDIGRWLGKNKKIMSALHKVQVNHGFLAEQQLVLKLSANIGDILNLGGTDQLITEADNPQQTTQVLKKQAKTDDTDNDGEPTNTEVLVARKPIEPPPAVA